MVIGFTVVAVPAVAVPGAAEPAGMIVYSHCVAAVLVQPKVAVVVPIFVAVSAVGFGQVGGGPQVTFATHPGLFTALSERNQKVKHPLPLEDVKGPGMVVPQYPPANPPGTFAAVFVLAIMGLVIEFPSKT